MPFEHGIIPFRQLHHSITCRPQPRQLTPETCADHFEKKARNTATQPAVETNAGDGIDPWAEPEHRNTYVLDQHWHVIILEMSMYMSQNGCI